MSAFGHFDKFPKVEGECPACGAHSLFVGSGGWVTCAVLGCPDPTLASEVFPRKADPDPGEKRETPSRGHSV